MEPKTLHGFCVDITGLICGLLQRFLTSIAGNKRYSNLIKLKLHGAKNITRILCRHNGANMWFVTTFLNLISRKQKIF